MITAKSGDAVTTRNSSFFKQIPRDTLSPPDNSSDGDDDSPTTPSEEALKDQTNTKPSAQRSSQPEEDTTPNVTLAI